ncbi:MAG: sensor domain-containing diguanylate cyclase [Actinobacteria bacterium]|nr:sensor domain-containing diguanylate cyclase [Actinomycetota bacterium]
MHQVELDAAKQIVDAAPVALALVDGSLGIHYANPRWHELAPADGSSWLEQVAPDDHDRLQAELRRAVSSGRPWNGSWLHERMRGRVLHGALEPLAGHEGERGVVTLIDPTAWADSPLAAGGRDPLTSLPTREPFRRALDRACQRAGGDAPVAVLFIDLDSLKPVNDEHGHLKGDRVLANIGRALAAVVRSDDVAARFGGDEFVVLCRDISMAEAVQLAARIHHSIANATPEVDRLTASIGIAAGVPPLDALDLLDAADQAMYRAKRKGPGRTESVVVVRSGASRRIA